MANFLCFQSNVQMVAYHWMGTTFVELLFSLLSFETCTVILKLKKKG